LDRTAFTFVHYDLEVRVDPAGHALAARGTIRLRNDSAAPQKDLTLQISSSLGWRMIELNGKPLPFVAEPYTTDLDHTGAVTEAVVTLPAPVPPKGLIELEVGYDGTVTPDATRLTRAGVPAATATRTDWDQIGEPVTAVRGVGYVAWYPVSLPAASLADTSLGSALADWKNSQRESTMRAKLCWVGETQQLSVVANGRLEGVNRSLLGATEEGTTQAGCSVYSFGPLGWTVPAFSIAEYTALSRPAITVYHLAGQQASAQEYALAAEKVLPFESDWFGAPRRKVEVVQLATPGDAPFESGPLLFTPFETADRKALEVGMIHQLVHASISSQRPWIEEGLAHFAQALEREQQDGRKAAIAYMQQFLPALTAAEAGAARNPGATPGLVSSGDEIMYRVKAMYVWWMLRDMVGDAALGRALKTYRPAQDNDTGYMPQLIEQAARRDLEWFFDDWVYRDRGLPGFRVDAAYPRATLRGGYVVAVTIEDLGAAAAEVPVFVSTSGGEMRQRMIVKGKQKATERIEVPGTPSEVTVNDGSVPAVSNPGATIKIAPPRQSQP
jgi:hypothetical protein